MPSAATTFQWYAETHRQGLRRGRADRTRRAVAGDPRADRRGGRDRALELPAHHHGLEGRRGPGDRQLGRPQAGLAVAADRAAPGRAGRRGRPAGRRPQRRHRARARWSGRALARHPGVDKVAFTGSTEVGRSLLRDDRRDRRQGHHARARRQEPAGRAGRLSATSRRRRRRSRWGIFYNSGQTCNAGSRLIVHRSVREELVERIAALGRELAPGRAARSRRRSLGAIVDARQLDKVLGYVDLGARGGRARRQPAGERVREETGGFYVEPTVLDGVDNALARRPRGDLRAGPDRDRVRGRGRRPGHRQRHALRAGGRHLDARRQPGASARARRSGPASSGSTPSTPPTSRSRSAATSSRASGATSRSTRSTATPSSRRPGSTSRTDEPTMTDDRPLDARPSRRTAAGGGRETGPREPAAAAAAWAQPRLRYRPTEVLSADELESIHLASLQVLEEIGMDFLEPESRDLLRRRRRDGRPGHAARPLRPGLGPRADHDRAGRRSRCTPRTRTTTCSSAATASPSARWPARRTSSRPTAGGGSATGPTTRTSSACSRCSTSSTSSPAIRSSRSTSTPRSATSTPSTTC